MSNNLDTDYNAGGRVKHKFKATVLIYRPPKQTYCASIYLCIRTLLTMNHLCSYCEIHDGFFTSNNRAKKKLFNLIFMFFILNALQYFLVTEAKKKRKCLRNYFYGGTLLIDRMRSIAS